MRVALLDELSFEERLDRTIESARAQPHAAAGPGGNFAHDGVTVQIFARERQKNMEGGGGERVEFLLWHSR